ncbi:hypothetical protein BSL78_18888 [Apostichopus japonicus]|uniref:Dynein heavy chain hydrolytic ATP-binding dynein motor region domain-containing protein n=1 Tax=Stichopus japonicus TaxID=307972 RepID=A0A2G8K8E6_STIJA|nr:hypothetical protein BSL78_18888 [Apostichopus japonicus]
MSALVNPVTPSPAFASWWKHFENSVKSTVGSLLNTCLESRLREDRLSNPENILEELAALETSAGNSPEERNLQQAVKQSFSHWLLRFPAQCVLVAEGVLWFRQMGMVLASGEKEQLERAKDQLQNRLKQYTSVLRDNVHLYLSSQSRARLHILLSNLIMQTLHYKEIVQGLLKLSDVSDKSFDWKKVLKYSLDMSSILCAKHDEKQEGKTQTITGYVFGPCHVNQLDSSFAYDYEYLGPNLRVVTTPLTDRCHLAMVMAMKQFECGTVVGPTSSGKTESIKDLAEVMNKQIRSWVEISSLWTAQTSPVSKCLVIWLLSVFARQLQHIFHAYQVLSNRSFDQNYETRGKSSVKNLRRHSVTTLLPTTAEKDENSSQKSRKKIFITSEEADIDELKNKSRGRRHSIVRGRQVSVTDHYHTSNDPVPLFINRPKSGLDATDLNGHTGLSGHTRDLVDMFRVSRTPGFGFKAVLSFTDIVCSENPDCHLDLRVLKSVTDVAALRMYSKRNVYELTGRGSSQNGSTPSVGLPADLTTETDLTDIFEQDELHKEENALVYAIQLHLLPRLNDRHQLQAVKELLRCVFPWGGGGPRPSTGGQEHDPVLLDAIQNQFVADKLQATPQHVNKGIDVWYARISSRPYPRANNG